MLEHLEVPRKALMGPWIHGLPDASRPGPQIHYLRELLRWWDHWLKGEDNGVMDEPALTVYVQRDRPPGLFPEHADGFWCFEKGWPPEDSVEQDFFFQAGGVLIESPPGSENAAFDQYVYRPEVGVTNNIWFSQASSLGMEQSLDEAFSLTYTTDPLEQDLEILGIPQVQLYAESTAENTAFVVKLTEVNPLGESNLVTYGVLNAAHRNSHTDPEPLEPGQVYELNIDLLAISWVFKQGHRIRVSVTSSHWPILWPLPDPAVICVHLDGAHPSKLVMPVIPLRESCDGPTFEAPPQAPDLGVKARPGEEPSLIVSRNILKGEVTLEKKTAGGFSLVDRDLALGHWGIIRSQTSTENPAISSVFSDCYEEFRYAHGLTVGSRGTATISSTKTQFVLHLVVNVEVNGQPFFEKTWLKTVRRYFV
jgi:hypothetical protein